MDLEHGVARQSRSHPYPHSERSRLETMRITSHTRAIHPSVHELQNSPAPKIPSDGFEIAAL